MAVDDQDVIDIVSIDGSDMVVFSILVEDALDLFGVARLRECEHQ